LSGVRVARLRTLVEALSWTVLAVTSFSLRWLGQPLGGIEHEELHTPTAATLLGHLSVPRHLIDLQYTDFCGGCSFEALAAAPLFSMTGPALWSWKLVPMAFGVGVLLLTWDLARLLGGTAGGRMAALLWLCGPTWAGVNSTLGFGSHFEVMFWVLLALRSAHLSDQRSAMVFWTGLWLGIAVWFDHAAAFALPLAVVSVWRAQTRAPAAFRVGLGLVLGLSPWLVSQRLRSGAAPSSLLDFTVYNRDLLDLLTRPVSLLPQRIDELVGPALWRANYHGALDSLPGGAIGVVGAVLTVLTLAWTARPRSSSLPTNGSVRMAVGLVVLYAVCLVWLSPTEEVRSVHGRVLTANGLRYHMPLVPLVALCGGVLWHRAVRSDGGHRWMGVLPGMILSVGLLARGAELWRHPPSLAGLHQNALDPDSVASRNILGPRASLRSELERLPPVEEAAARRVLLIAIGNQLVGPAWTSQGHGPAASDDVTRELAGLSPMDLADVHDGVALHTRDRSPGTWSSRSFVRPGSDIEPILQASPHPELLARALLSRAPLGSSHDISVLLRRARGRQTGAPIEPVWRDALAHALGVSVAREALLGDTPSAALLAASAPDAAGLRIHYWQGAGRAVGEYRGDLPTDLTGSLPTDAGPPFETGRREGRRRVGWP